jgi:phage portal protein BeeE
MGIFSALRLSNSRPAADSIVSPWTDAQLRAFVWSDVFGNIEDLPLTRAEAMRVPAVAKARNLLCATIGRQPLVARDADGLVLPRGKQPTWLYRTDQDVISTQHLWTWITDDLIFVGHALLSVQRGSDGFPVSVDRISPDRYTITDGAILVDEKPVDESEVCYLPGLVDGLLDIGSRSIRGAKYVEDAWVGKARNPVASTVIKQTDSNVELEQDEADNIVRQYSKNRRDPDGAVTFLPAGLDIEALGTADPAMFIEARNALRTDIGSFLGIPSSVMDASLSTASLTYSTAEGNRNAFFDQAVPLFAGAIEYTLSLDGKNPMVPRGQSVRFDFSSLFATLPAPTGPATED